MRDFLFPIEFTTDTLNGNMTKWLREHNIDYFYHYETLLADVFGDGNYYALFCEHVCKNIYEVYYDTTMVEKRPENLRRLTKNTNKVHRIANLYNEVEIEFGNGKKITTTIWGHADYVRDFFLSNTFVVEGTLMKAASVRFLDVKWEF